MSLDPGELIPLEDWGVEVSKAYVEEIEKRIVQQSEAIQIMRESLKFYSIQNKVTAYGMDGTVTLSHEAFGSIARETLEAVDKILNLEGLPNE